MDDPNAQNQNPMGGQPVAPVTGDSTVTPTADTGVGVPPVNQPVEPAPMGETGVPSQTPTPSEPLPSVSDAPTEGGTQVPTTPPTSNEPTTGGM